MLQNKIVVITGGLGLLGLSFAKEIVGEGGIVILVDINAKNAKTVIEELNNNTDEEKASFHQADITSEKSVEELIKSLIKEFGHIDTWVNNAFPRPKSVDLEEKREYSPHFFEMNSNYLNESVALNLGSIFVCSKLIAKQFVNQKFGHIINISSIYGVIAPRFEIYEDTGMTMPVDYAMIKSGIIHFSKYLSKYMKNKSVRVNTLSPGGVFNNQPREFVDKYSKISSSGAMLKPEHLSKVLAFLISENASHINGQNIVVDDGWTL